VGIARPAELEKLQWLRQIMDWQSETKDSSEFLDSLRVDLFHDEVYVFTPKGEVKSLPAGSTPVDFAYAIHTTWGTAASERRSMGVSCPSPTGCSPVISSSSSPPGRRRAVARLAAVRGQLRCPQQDPAVVQARAA
jgi:hypothetical protein